MKRIGAPAVLLFAVLGFCGCASQRMVLVFDRLGNPIPGATIVFVGEKDSGERLAGSIQTNRDGLANVPKTRMPTSLVIHKSGFEPVQLSPTRRPIIRVFLVRNKTQPKSEAGP